MERLVKDAAKIDKSVKANSLSYANIVKAIHAVQENLDITGTTAKEAEHTISGSLASMKSAWGNLLPSLIQGGDSFDQCVDNLVDTVLAFKDNVMPAIEKALSGVGTLIEKLAPTIEKEFPKLVEELLPPLVKAATALFAGVIKALPTIIKTFIKEIPYIVSQLGKAVADAIGGESFVKPITAAVEVVGTAIIGGLAAFKGVSAFKKISSMFSSIKEIGGASEGISKSLNPFSALAKVNPKVILKGMVNLSIILGGLLVLTVAFLAVAPYIAKLSDVKSITKVVGVMAALGILGSGMSLLASKIGNIPVAKVALGLANIAIVVGGLSALYLLIGAVSLINFDVNKLTHIIKIITVLGAVGSAMTVFAGLIGMIPIPVVLAGLANIALVIGGMTAIVVAFAKLSEIKGFSEFITTGGNLLAKLFGVIGKIGGSLVGGLGEGISNSLPTIGKNIAAFATALKPMFTMFQGVDVKSIGSFFKSLGSFMLQMAQNNIMSFFAGETDLGSIATQLSTFAGKSAGFFTKVATFPENGFTQATKLFNCLAGMKSLPKEGGIKNWFNGEVNYSSLASGLASLSSESVTKFFTTVAQIPEAGFERGGKLFNCLAGLKSLPKEGGVKGWFNGSISFGSIASGLKQLGSDGVKKFFTMAGSLSDKAFTNAKKLFKTLSDLGNLPKQGGLWDGVKKKAKEAMGVDTSTKLESIANQLATFGEKTAKFFNQVNKLKIGNLTALPIAINNIVSAFSRLKNVTGKEFTNLSKIVANVSGKVLRSLRAMISKVKSTINGVNLAPAGAKMMNGLIRGINSRRSALISTINSVVRTINSKFNSVISGANWTLKQFGSDKRLSAFRYANGTSGHRGGNAVVNDGRGAELVQMPNGRTFIPNGRNVFLPNAPKGMKVLDAGRTASLMGKSSPTFRYAKGTGDLDVFSYEDGKSLSNAIVGKYGDTKGLSGFTYNLAKAAMDTTKGAMSKWADKLIEEFGAKGLGDYVASAGVSQWRSTVIRALKMEGQYSEANVKRTLYQMQTESGGNPRAINLWDSNAKKGTPSKGLMQVIDPTFKSYARPGFNKNIYDPLSNILASVRYAKSRYGSLAKAYQGHGYANGVGAKSISLPQYKPETSTVRSNTTNSTETNTYAPVFNLTISGTTDDRAMAQKVKRWVSESLEECFESMARRNSRAF